MRFGNRLRLRARRARLALGRVLGHLLRGEPRRAASVVATHLGGLGRARNPYADVDPESLEDWHRDRARESRDFDREHGVDTAGMVFVEDMDVDHRNFLRAGNYAPTRPSTLRAILSELQREVPLEPMTFLDYGSGKGRALLLASEFPFRRVVGVEFARDLCRVARDNVRRYRSDAQRCTRVEVIHGDAVEIEPPREPLLAYLYSPFDETVLEELLARLEASWRRWPRDVVVLLVAPVAPRPEAEGEEPRRRFRRMKDLVGSTPFLEPMRSGARPGEEFAIFRSVDIGAPAASGTSSGE